MKKISENELAKAVAKVEGKKVSVNIGQIKEVMKCLLDKLAGYDAVEVLMLVNKHKKARR